VSSPLVSVLIPVHNGERFLGAALQSLFAQDYRNFEAIVIDDGSDDGTAAVARSFPDVRYRHQANQGVAAARNAGLEMARGELIAFLDHDDLWPPTKLSVQVGHLVAHPSVGCVLGRQRLFFEPGIDPPAWLRRDPVYGDLGGIDFVSAVIRAEILRAVGGFDTAFRTGEDRDLLIRLREQGVEIAVVPEVVLHRRLHGSNLTYRSGASGHSLLKSLKSRIDRTKAAQPVDGSG
jgi:glycosyltransferase involved in cell wall biosynthesis